MRNRFLDPATGASYEWDINHAPDGEQNFGVEQAVEWTAATGGTPLPQLGSAGPQVLQVSGTIMRRSQLDAMIDFYAICLNEQRTIYFRDFTGDEYEVLITAFNPRRQGVLRNSRDPVNAPDHIWRYDLKMDVVRVISGPWVGV